MQRAEFKNAGKEGISGMPAYKTNVGYQNEHLHILPKVKKEIADHGIDQSSLLTANKARDLLKNLDGWQITDDHKMIYRGFILKDFMAAVDLIDRIAVIARDEGHHPDIHLTQCHNLRVVLSTHDVGGLSGKDFSVALKINAAQSAHKLKPVAKVRLITKKNAKKTTIKKIVNRVKKPVKKA